MSTRGIAGRRSRRGPTGDRFGLLRLRRLSHVAVAAVVAVAFLVGAASGYGLARAFPVATGGAHSCPAGAPASACTYPPNHGQQQETWAIFGAIIAGGLVLAVLRPPRQPPL